MIGGDAETFGRRGVTALCGSFVVAWALLGWARAFPAPLGAEAASLSEALREGLALKASALRAGALWQPFSYAFLHGSWAHLAANVFGLWLTGGTLSSAIGERRFLWLFALGTVAGAVGFLLSVAWDPRLPIGTLCMGASASVAACLGAVTALAPRCRVTLWALVVPIPLRAGWLFPLCLAFFAAEAWLWPSVTAYGAHVGGWVMGLAFGRALRQ